MRKFIWLIPKDFVKQIPSEKGGKEMKLTKKLTKDEKVRRMMFARMEAARAWQGKKTSKLPMDVKLAQEFANILVVHMYEPHLGCATTRELLAEIAARVDLEYKTLGESDL